jgi:beta-glucanase (GH16 family)
VLVIAAVHVTSGSHATRADRLLWSDEFDGPAGAPPNPNVWTLETGGGGWGADQIQCYTTALSNARLDGQSHLVVAALHAPRQPCPDGGATNYTSARLRSKSSDVAPGEIEVRAKLPTGHGIWPALWTLGSDYSEIGWPDCGEIDLAEATGREPNVAGVHVHGPGYSGEAAPGVKRNLGNSLSSAFHTYSAEIKADRVTFRIDGRQVWRFMRSAVPAGQPWVFDRPSMMILNVAVGGGFAGPPDLSTQWPQSMLVDYVRVYR